MDDPRKIIDFIERNELGYILGNAVRAIIYAVNKTNYEQQGTLDSVRLMHLKDARQFLNVEIKRLGKKKTK